VEGQQQEKWRLKKEGRQNESLTKLHNISFDHKGWVFFP